MNIFARYAVRSARARACAFYHMIMRYNFAGAARGAEELARGTRAFIYSLRFIYSLHNALIYNY